MCTTMLVCLCRQTCCPLYMTTLEELLASVRVRAAQNNTPADAGAGA